MNSRIHAALSCQVRAVTRFPDTAAGWSTEGKLPTSIERFSFGFDSWGGDPFVVWLDGIKFE